MKIMKFLIIGVILLLSAQLSRADVNISKYVVDGFASANYELERGATFRVTVSHDYSGSPINIVGAKFYLDYNPQYLEYKGITSDNLAGGLTSKTNPNFHPATGQIRYQRDAGSGAGLPAAADQACFTITFHVLQNAQTNDPTFLWWLSPDADNVKLVGPGDANITGNINGFQAAKIKGSADPTFDGINSVGDPQTGNSLNLNWQSYGNGATDFNDGAATYYSGHTGQHNGAGLRYNIYRGTQNSPMPSIGSPNVKSSHNGFTFTNTNLDDGTPYTYKITAIDDCTPVYNESEKDVTITETPTDHTPPTKPTLGVGSSNQELPITWGGGGGDVGGYLVIRYLTKPSGGPTLVSASDKDTLNEGNVNGDIYTVGQDLNGGKVIFNEKSSGNTDKGADLPEGHLTNGTTYWYQVIAHDPVGGSPNHQGRNYSQYTEDSGTPGVEPGALGNFIAISSPEAGQISLFWNKPVEDWYGGALFWYSKDFDQKWDWYKTWGDSNSGPINVVPDKAPSEWLALVNSGNVGIIGVYQTDPTILAGEQESLVVIADLGNELLNLSDVYFIKGFAFNKTGIDFPNTLLGVTEGELSGRRFSDVRLAAALPAGTGGGASGPITYSLSKVTDGLGLNDVAILQAPPLLISDPNAAVAPVSGVQTVADLVTAIDTIAGSPVVTAIGWMEGGQVVGYFVSPNGYQATQGANIPADPAGVNLVRGTSYQISVIQDITIIISGGG